MKTIIGNILAAVCTFAVVTDASAGLVAKWDFNNYDPENPTSAAILAPTVGSLAAIPCTGTTDSIEVTDGTLGSITVVNTGLPQGDYALSIPNGAHLKIPLPSGIVRDKSWSLRIRFNYPGTANTANTLVSGQYDGVGNGLWLISNLNLIRGDEGIFGTSAEENINSTGNNGVQKNNGWNTFRLVSRDAWHSFTAHFGPDGAASTLDGYRGVALLDKIDIRDNFTGDGFVLCAGDSSATTYISSVEVWEDTPIYRDANGGTCISSTSRKVFSGCSLEGLRDMYISVKGLGTWGDYARTMSSWEHIVTTDGEGNVTDLKIDLRTKNGDQAILCDFAPSDSDVAGNSLRMQYGIGWPSPYFTSSGGFTSSANYQTAPDVWNGGGYAPYNTYALPFRPIDGSLNWSMQMGTGKFGNPIFSIVGNNPTLTFDASPEADSITLDCGRGDGHAGVTFAYASDALKTMSGLGSLNITDGVTLTVPVGVSITGALTFTAGAKMEIDLSGLSLSSGDELFTAAGGITLPAGKTIADLVYVAGGSVELSQDGTQMLLAPDASVVLSAVWTGLGDRSDVLDPLNWTCCNYAGTVLDGEIPGEDTSITVSGATTFNYTADQAGRLVYHSLTIGPSISLAADCDWRGFGTAIPYSASPTIDLQGRKLYVCDGAAAVTVTDTSTGTPGEYHLDLPSNMTVSALNMTGNVRFVKEGAGEMTLKYSTNPSYSGGTEICGGIIATTHDATTSHQFGAGGSEIVVKSGAKLYPYGNQCWLSFYKLVLDGGTLYTWWGGSANGVIFGNTELKSDSVIDIYTGGRFTLWAGNTAELNGHKLTLTGSGEMVFVERVNLKGGTIESTNCTIKLSNSPVNAQDVEFVVDGPLNLGGNTLNASNYVARYSGSTNAGTGAFKVFGTFKPSEHDKFYGVTMQDGSTIDFSSRTNALPLVSSFASGDRTLKFADNATVYLDFGDFEVNAQTPIITWEKKPANIETVKFESADPDRKHRFVCKNNGLYKFIGLKILIK